MEARPRSEHRSDHVRRIERRFATGAVVAQGSLIAGIALAGVLGSRPLLWPSCAIASLVLVAAALIHANRRQRDRDKLTGLANQAAFATQARAALRRPAARGARVSVLAVDLDGFSLANESLGPSAGDDLLRQAAARIARASGPAQFVARRSADEFLILVGVDGPGGPATGRRGSSCRRPEEVACAVQSAFGSPLRAGGEDVYFSACVGIGVLCADGSSDTRTDAADRLLARAQQALSRARERGPGSIVVYDDAAPAASPRLSLITRLRRAIDRREFVAAYQPVFDLERGEMLGVEALLRWEDPERGVIAPGAFIDVAEETGLIVPIGAWMIDQACRQAREWEDLGLNLDVAFNLSPRQLWDPELLRKLVRTVERTGVQPHRLTVEITESSALGDPAAAAELFEQLRFHGLRLAIDDFGVGLSSLSRLREIPVDVLKIDRSFVCDVSTSPSGAVMVQTIIALARNLGLGAHAEGVETEDQRRFLLENGCMVGQGFLFSGPLPPQQIPNLYMRSRPAPIVAAAP